LNIENFDIFNLLAIFVGFKGFFMQENKFVLAEMNIKTFLKFKFQAFKSGTKYQIYISVT